MLRSTVSERSKASRPSLVSVLARSHQLLDALNGPEKGVATYEDSLNIYRGSTRECNRSAPKAIAGYNARYPTQRGDSSRSTCFGNCCTRRHDERNLRLLG